MKRLFVDIETTPCIGYFWRPGWKINIPYENVIEPAKVIMAGYKLEGSTRPTRLVTWDDEQSDEPVILRLAEILADADEVVAHNGARFDIPWLRTRAAYYGIAFPTVPIVDTCAQARKHFYFPENRLDSLAKYFGLKPKLKTDFDLWKRVMAGNEQALTRMAKYCQRDVKLLEDVYKVLQPYLTPSTHAGVASGGTRRDCPKCGSTNVKEHAVRYTKLGLPRVQMRCQNCEAFYTITRKVAEEAQ